MSVELTEVGDGVVAVRGRDVNWTILRDGASFTLVDTGYPGYGAGVRDSIVRAGLDLSGLEAIVVTHAHIDHIGGVPALLAHAAVPVYVGAPELPMAIGNRTESAGPLDVAVRLWKPRVVPWSLRITAAGGAGHAVVPDAIGVADGAVLDVPGRPAVVLTPGHTSGHICLQAGGALLTGDALITGHAITGRKGPQLAASFFHTDAHRAAAALDRIAAVDAEVIVPGHGPGLAWLRSRRGGNSWRRMNTPRQGRTTSWLRPIPPRRPYHQLARNDVHRWWRPLVALLFILVFGMGAMLALVLGMVIIVWTFTGQWLEFGSGDVLFTNDLANLSALIASVAIILPVVLLATLMIDRRPIGSLSSVQGRLRWRWLALCLLPAVGFVLVSVGAAMLLGLGVSSDGETGHWVGWDEFWPALLIIVLLVPAQATAEEYAFRGWLLQAVGSWTARFGSPAWPAILISAIPFVVGHGYTDWGPVDIGLFAVVTGWVVIRTGGLEAGIALHIVNNMAGMGAAAAEGDLSLAQGSIPWTETLTTAVPLVLWALIVVWMFGHTGSKRPIKRLS